jgi:hypothetical protein
LIGSLILFEAKYQRSVIKIEITRGKRGYNTNGRRANQRPGDRMKIEYGGIYSGGFG